MEGGEKQPLPPLMESRARCRARTRGLHACRRAQGGLIWAVRTCRRCSLRAAFAVGSTPMGHAHAWAALTAGSTCTAGARCQLCVHTSAAHHMLHSGVDAARWAVCLSLFTLVRALLVRVKSRPAWQGLADVSGMCYISLGAVEAAPGKG